MKTLLYIFIFNISAISFAQITNIPDPNFEQALIDLGIDSDGIVNGQVLTSDIDTVTNLDISNKGIQDLTGIEGFTALEVLDVSSNMVSQLSFSQNPELVELIFDGSFHLLSMDVTSNTNLEVLRSTFSFLTELDVSNNINLLELSLGEPSPAGTHLVEYLDLSHNILLQKLYLENLEVLGVIDLRSGNNSVLLDVYIHCSLDFGFFCEPYPCLMVDDVIAAQNNEFPYSEWDALANYSEDCTAGLEDANTATFSIHPNPAKNELFLTSKSNNGNLTLKIFNTTGKLLSTQKLELEYQSSIDVSQLSSGIYFLNIGDENGNTTIKKFIKE